MQLWLRIHHLSVIKQEWRKFFHSNDTKKPLVLDPRSFDGARAARQSQLLSKLSKYFRFSLSLKRFYAFINSFRNAFVRSGRQLVELKCKGSSSPLICVNTFYSAKNVN